MIDLNRLISKIDRFCIEFAIVDSILILEIRIEVIRRSNSDFRFDSTTSIRFGDPNRISLMGGFINDVTSGAGLKLCMKPNIKYVFKCFRGGKGLVNPQIYMTSLTFKTFLT